MALSCAHAHAPALAPTKSVEPTRPDPFQSTLDWKPEETSAPRGLWIRLKAPVAVLPRILKLTADPTLVGFSNPRALAGLALGGELSALIDLDAPLDVLVVPRPKHAPVVIAVAHPTDEPHFAPEKLGPKLRSVSPGRWEIHPSDGGENVRCELWHVTAPVGYRVVCGQESAQIAQAAPFLLGRLAKQPLLSDARVELSHEAFVEAGAEGRLRAASKSPNGDANRTDHLGNELGKWLIDAMASAESMALNLNLSEQDVEFGVEFDYLAARTSAVFQSWLGVAPQPLPQQFWQVLGSSPLAIASAGVDPQTMKLLSNDSSGPWRAGITGIEEATGMRPELAKQIRVAMGDLPERLRFTVSQAGPLPRSLPKKPLGKSTTDSSPSASAPGWLLAGFAGSGERFQAGLDVLIESSKAKPPSAARGPQTPTRWVRLGKLPADFPAESYAYRVDSADKSSAYTWVLPSPDWVWVLSGSNEQQLLTQARGLLPTLRETAPSEVDPTAFGPEPPLLAMSFSLAALKNIAGESMAKLDVSTLPFGGSARVFLRLTGKRQDIDSRSVLSLNVWTRWSPAAIADLAELVKAAKRASSGEEVAAPPP